MLGTILHVYSYRFSTHTKLSTKTLCLETLIPKYLGGYLLFPIYFHVCRDTFVILFKEVVLAETAIVGGLWPHDKRNYKGVCNYHWVRFCRKITLSNLLSTFLFQTLELATDKLTFLTQIKNWATVNGLAYEYTIIY